MNAKPSNVGFVLAGVVILPPAFVLSWTTDDAWGFAQRAVLDAIYRDALLGFALSFAVGAIATVAFGSLAARTRFLLRWSSPLVAAAGLAVGLFWFQRESATPNLALPVDVLREARNGATGGAMAAIEVGSFVASAMATVASIVFAIDARRAKRARFDGRRFAVLALTLLLVVIGFMGFRRGDGITLAALPAAVGAFGITLGDLDDDDARAAAGTALLYAIFAVSIVATAFGLDTGRASRFALALAPLAPLVMVAAILDPRQVFGAIGTALRPSFAPLVVGIVVAMAPWFARSRFDAWLRAPMPTRVEAPLTAGLGSEEACAELVLDDLVTIRGDRVMVGGRDLGPITMLDDDAATAKLVDEHAPADRDVWLELDPQTSGSRFGHLLRALETSRRARFDGALVSSHLLPMRGCALHFVARRDGRVVCDAVGIAVRACIPSNEEGVKLLEVNPGDGFTFRTRSLGDHPAEFRTDAIQAVPSPDLLTALDRWWHEEGRHRDQLDMRFDQLVLDTADEPVAEVLARFALARSIPRSVSTSVSGRKYLIGGQEGAFDVTIGTRHALDRKPTPPPPLDASDDDTTPIDRCRRVACTAQVLAAAYRARAEKEATGTYESAADRARDAFRDALALDPNIAPRTNDARVTSAFARARANPRPDFAVESLQATGIDPEAVRAAIEKLRPQLRLCSTPSSRIAVQVDLDGGVIAGGCQGDFLRTVMFEPREQPASFSFTLAAKR